jgi:hypothetical protein
MKVNRARTLTSRIVNRAQPKTLSPFPVHRPTVAQLDALQRGRAKRWAAHLPKFCYCGREILPGPNFAKKKFCSYPCAMKSDVVRENGRRTGLLHGRQALARWRVANPGTSAEWLRVWRAWRWGTDESARCPRRR